MMRLHPGNAAFLVCLSSVAVAIAALGLFRSHAVQEVNAAQAVQLTNLTDGELKNVVIRLERSQCYGSCPAYKVAIYGNGRLEYVGESNVKLKGTKEAEIAMGDFKHLVSEFEKANYFSTDQYAEKNCSCRFCTDMPTVITEIQVKGTTHRVEHYYGCTCAPKALWELEQAIDKIVRTEQWTGDVSKQGPFGTTCFTR
jgi:hypothetical protein